MLFLLPPSESKASGGSGLNIGQVALTFGSLNSARELVKAAWLEYLASDEGLAKFGQELFECIRDLDSLPTMAALDRFTGTLYDAIHGRGLKGSGTEDNRITAEMFQRAKDSLLIQTALFGLIPATQLIPNYRLSAGQKLPGVSLKQVWSEAHASIWPRLENGPIIDLRSKAYAELAPIPNNVEHFWVEVVSEDSRGQQRALNHFNKKAKGEFIRAVLTQPSPVSSMSELKKAAKDAGHRLERSGRELKLIVKLGG